MGIEPEIGAEITLTYTVGAWSTSPFEKTDTFTRSGWWEFDDLSPVHYINVSEEYAKEIEKETISKGQYPFRIDLNVTMARGIDFRREIKRWTWTWDTPEMRMVKERWYLSA